MKDIKLQTKFMTTGCKSLDDILGGGLQYNKVYELWCHSITERLYFLHQLLCSSQFPADQGGIEYPVAYIDVEGFFSIRLYERFANRLGVDANKIKNNLRYQYLHSFSHLVYLIARKLSAAIEELNLNLILIDNLANIPPKGFSRRHLDYNRLYEDRIITKLQKIANNHQVIIVNTCRKKTQNDNVSNYIEISRLNQISNLRKISFKESNSTNNRSCYLDITREGFIDLNLEETEITSLIEKEKNQDFHFLLTDQFGNFYNS